MPGVRHKILAHGGRRLRLVEYSRELPPHWCERGHIGYVLAGDFEIQYETATETYTAGDGIFIPDGPEHKHLARTLSDRVTIVFVENA